MATKKTMIETGETAELAKPKRAVKPAKADASSSEETSPAKKTVRKAPAKARQTANAVAPAGNASNVSLYGLAPYQPAAGEEYMSDAQLAHFRTLLSNWKAELMDEVDRTMSYIQDESAALPDVNDRATQEEEFAIELRTRDRERKLIRKIEQALQSIDTGDYGFCETCGIEIGLRRLEARPTATQCIDCKTLSEIKEKQEHG